ncbi:MAG: hypothetical protein KGJ14_03120, partial [Nitrospirota bacterium]|nr:hypothetical protein [Nitrospirota bacterium]
MRVDQALWTKATGWQPFPLGRLGAGAQLVLLFGSRALLKDTRHIEEVRRAYPLAHFLGCSTAGEICGTQVLDDSLVVTALQFDHAHIEGTSTTVGEAG